jgi:ribosomal protein L32
MKPKNCGSEDKSRNLSKIGSYFTSFLSSCHFCRVYNSQWTGKKKAKVCLKLFLPPLLQVTINRASKTDNTHHSVPQNKAPNCAQKVLSHRIDKFCDDYVHTNKTTQLRTDF